MKWHQINTRRISLQMCLFWNDGFNAKEFETYGFGVKNQLNYFDGKKTQYWVSTEDWKHYKEGLENIIVDPKWIERLPWEAQEFLENQLKRFSAEFPKDLSGMSNEQLLELQKKVAEEVGWTNSRTWIVYLSNEVIVDRVRAELSKVVSDSQEVDEYLLSFSTPIEMNNAMLEQFDLLTLAQNKESFTSEELAEQLMIHTKKYEYIPMFGFDHDPYTIDHFRTELQSIEKPQEELSVLQSDMRERKEVFEQQLARLNLSSSDLLYKLIKLLKHTVFVRDYRDTLRQQMYLLDRYMYDEIAKRIGGLNAEQITNLTNSEIEQGLVGGKHKEISDLAKERMKGFLVIQNDQDTEVFTANEAHARAQQELGIDETELVSELTGIPGSPGCAEGIARIVETNKDLHKISEGDIMIAPVTRQDYVPVMRKCAAIVNDEGGITNHAAIVSREFGIPCIVGTQKATRVFRDGDRVLVDADAGIVKKLD